MSTFGSGRRGLAKKNADRSNSAGVSNPFGLWVGNAIVTRSLKAGKMSVDERAGDRDNIRERRESEAQGSVPIGQAGGGGGSLDQQSDSQPAGRGQGATRNGRGSERRVSPTADSHPSPAEILARLAGSTGPSIPSDDKFARDYPTLWHFLTIREGESADGKNTTSIVLVCEGTGYTVIVSLKAYGKSTTFALHSLSGFFQQLEQGLRDPSTPWRDMKDWKRKKEEKKKEEKS